MKRREGRAGASEREGGREREHSGDNLIIYREGETFKGEWSAQRRRVTVIG